ncbi:MAG: exopolysaccharide Pel transporter PelG [Ruminiclostridium sp.]|nr:exopolysaccharide Pel transporter PelG [Ruminiclostridium sp.]
MAGIGFELKKLFEKRGLFASIRAYGVGIAVCAGPMLLNVALLSGIRYISERTGMQSQEQEFLICMLSYTFIASLLITSVLSMVTARYTADMLYQEQYQFVLPSLFGSQTISLTAGIALYGGFLLLSGIEPVYILLCTVLFSELIVVWSQIQYITAIKDYKSILAAFFTSIVIALGSGFLIGLAGVKPLIAFMSGVIIGYGVMLVWNFYLLHLYFPAGEGSAFQFLLWIKRYPKLFFIGLFTTLGLFGHIIIMWFSPAGVSIRGLLYAAPSYDIPALFAFLSTLITTVNFITSLEVNFYPYYRNYFDLMNTRGMLTDMRRAEDEMLTVLKQELFYLALQQGFATILLIVIGGPVFLGWNMGFNETFLGTFNTLCIGYALYAIGNSIMLVQLYFTDDTGAFYSSLLFMLSANIGTLFFLFQDYRFYGFGFLIGGFVMYVCTWIRLALYARKLVFHILCSQPVNPQNNQNKRWRTLQLISTNCQLLEDGK